MNDWSVVAAGAGAVGLAAWYMLQASKAHFKHLPYDNQSRLLPGPERIRESYLVEDGNVPRYTFEDATTVYGAFVRGKRVSNNGPCVGWKPSKDEPYKWMSYQEMFDESRSLGSGLLMKGIQPGQNTFVGIYAVNRKEWIAAEQMCSMFSMIVVALYDTLGENAIKFIIKQADISVVVCDSATRARSLLSIAQEVPLLKTIVMIEDIPGELHDEAKSKGINLCSFREIVELGKNNPRDVVPPKPDDIVTLCYTSGTTGDPKGVIITHENEMCVIASVLLTLKSNPAIPPITADDTAISYLPLAHMFERMNEAILFLHGAKLGFFQGDIRLLMDDVKELKPTYMPAVPRLLNRLYDRINGIIAESGFLTRTLFTVALMAKEAEVKRGIIRNDGFWDRLVFRKIQSSLGGKVRLMIVGSAPISEEVMTLTRCVLGVCLLEGYGQTECTASVTFTLPGDPKAGHVGPPLPGSQIKLVDVPELDYYAKDDKGEICVKGPFVSSGYYKNEEKTKETFDEDGWLHTGDIGHWLPNGTMRILDRVKHIFKLSQGEYLAPEKIENIYVRSGLVAQVFVDGNSLHSFAVGVVVPDAEGLSRLVKHLGIPDGSLEELCKNEVVNKSVLEEITSIGKEAGLKSFEQVKKIYLHPEQFTVANEMLTPTFKAKRPTLRKYFKSQLEQMYA